MKVFLSWSGSKSHKVAMTLRDWLPSVIQSIEPYVSSEDIDKGARWSTDIAKELEDSGFGILCVTKENLHAPWLTFEAGALSKKLEKSYVSPFLFDIKRSEINGPILQFQSTVHNQEDVLKLVKTINKACGDTKLSDERIDKAFKAWYPTLQSELKKVTEEFKDSDTVIEEPEKEKQEILEELLELTRINQKILRSPNVLLPPEYLKDILTERKESKRELMVYEEQRHYQKELEHLLFRLRDLTEKYKMEKQPIDQEYEENIQRISELFERTQHLGMRARKYRIR
ncbi:TIR domain-containing protein [Tenacibaculum finnmarkense]|uniref:TIR domain-containing protein n=1 Tax=Tenacibaculum finnmarkense TaxID=2781243 RepID=UPI0023014031|nr:TIR domain-containing protein [Tenacibaculum finnmarkense]WCC46207.1 TIR domain-containing protein [Tenacibaculum finnmarkense]